MKTSAVILAALSATMALAGRSPPETTSLSALPMTTMPAGRNTTLSTKTKTTRAWNTCTAKKGDMKPWRPVPGETWCQFCLDWACVRADQKKNWKDVFDKNVMSICGPECPPSLGGKRTKPLQTMTTWPSDHGRDMFSRMQGRQNRSRASSSSAAAAAAASSSLAALRNNTVALFTNSNPPGWPVFTRLPDWTPSSSVFTFATSTKFLSRSTPVHTKTRV